MPIDLPPPLWTPEAPAILRLAEPSQVQAHRDLIRLGVQRHTRRAIITEIARLRGAPLKIAKAASADLADYAKLPPSLAMLMVNHLNGFGAGGGEKTLTFQTSAVDAVDRTIYTFTAQAIGSPATDRYVIVGAVGSNTATISGVKCATVAMTNLANQAGTEAASLWILLVTSGTTADIEVTFSAGVNRCGIGVWSATGLASATPVATGVSTTTTAPTVATVAGGFAVAITQPTGASPTWAVLTSDFATDNEAGVFVSGAHGSTTGASITPTVTSSGATRCTMAVATF